VVFDRRAMLACATAAFLAALVYLNALHGPFVYDDYRTIVVNSSIEHLLSLPSIVAHDVARPMVNLSYALDHRIWGDAPFGFHVTSLLLHVLNVVLLFQVAWRFTVDLQHTRGPKTVGPISPLVAAFTAAALFAVHPMMTEAVGYISGRSELLCGAFFLSAALCTRRWMLHQGTKWWVLTVVFWLAAILSKEIAALYPLVMMAYGRLVLGGPWSEKRDRLVRLYVPLLAAATLLAVARVTLFGVVEHPGGLAVKWQLVLSEITVIGRYVGMLVVPSGQAIFHDVRIVPGLTDPAVLIAIGTIALLVVVAIELRRTLPLMSVGVFWFLLLVVPSSALAIVNQGELMAEHRVYLASGGLFLAAGTGLSWLFTRLSASPAILRWAAGAVVAIEIVSLGGATLARNTVWSDPVTLWREAVSQSPNNWLPQASLGEALHAEGRHQEAIRAYQAAVRLNQKEAYTYFKLGLCYAELGRFKEAAVTFDRLRQVDPASTLVPTGLGIVAMMAGNVDLARRDFQTAIAQNPREIMARQWQAVLEEVVAKNPAEALRLCEEIHRISPGTLGDDDCIARNRAQLGPRIGGH
jgi:Flp pilus assembly protein TadD